jgi:hypothetical protein
MELEERERGELHKIVVGGVAAVPGYSALALSLCGVVQRVTSAVSEQSHRGAMRRSARLASRVTLVTLVTCRGGNRLGETAHLRSTYSVFNKATEDCPWRFIVHRRPRPGIGRQLGTAISTTRQATSIIN